MTCRDCQSEFWDLLDGTLKGRDIHEVVRHALECVPCAEALRDHVRLERRFYEAGAPVAPDSLKERIVGALPPHRRMAVKWESLKIAAALLITLSSTLYFLTADAFEEIRETISRETSYASKLIETTVADSTDLFRSAAK